MFRCLSFGGSRTWSRCVMRVNCTGGLSCHGPRRRWPSGGTMHGHRRRRWACIGPPLGHNYKVNDTGRLSWRSWTVDLQVVGISIYSKHETYAHVVSMLGQLQRPWTSIKTTLGQCFVFVVLRVNYRVLIMKLWQSYRNMASQHVS